MRLKWQLWTDTNTWPENNNNKHSFSSNLIEIEEKNATIEEIEEKAKVSVQSQSQASSKNARKDQKCQRQDQLVIIWKLFRSNLRVCNEVFNPSDVLKENWDGLKPIKQNLTEMGLAFDANKTLSSSKSTKRLLIDRAKGKMPQSEEKKKIGAKLDTEVVQQLEKEADEAMAVAKSQKYRFPKEEVRWMTDMMDRYGDDFKVKCLAN